MVLQKMQNSFSWLLTVPEIIVFFFGFGIFHWLSIFHVLVLPHANTIVLTLMFVLGYSLLFGLQAPKKVPWHMLRHHARSGYAAISALWRYMQTVQPSSTNMWKRKALGSRNSNGQRWMSGFSGTRTIPRSEVVVGLFI